MAGPTSRVRAKTIRPRFNTFSLIDLMTGRFLKGKDGLWYLDGGYGQIMGFGGRGNTFKSALSCTMASTVSLRYKFEYTEFYDSELSMKVGRVQDYIDSVVRDNHWAETPQILDLLDDDTTPWNMTNSAVQPGEMWWKDNCRGELSTREKIKEKDHRVTPFKELDGTYATMLNPWIFTVDSLSEFHTGSVERKYEKGTAGESDLNTEAMDDARSKAQIMKQMPTVAARGNYYFGLIAHADDELKMDMYAPSQKKLEGLKGNLKFKGVPGRGFSFLPNSVLLATGTSNGLNKADKMPEYPHPNMEPRVGDTDLRIIQFTELRGKSGPTGAVLDICFSQLEGLLVGVTEYHYIKEHAKEFGITSSGSGGAFKKLDLYPDVTFTRKTLRALLVEDPKFKRAMGITASLAYITMNWFDLEPQYRMSMQELHDSVVAAGYDWDEILSGTVEYWYFQDQEKEIGKPTITIMTLLDMALGILKPKVLKCSK